jgi:hypothetical protein
MAVPTKEEFQEYIVLLESLYVHKLEEKLRDLPPSYSEISDAILEINKRRHEASLKLNKTVVGLWLDGQHVYHLGMDSLNRGFNYKSPDDLLEHQTNEVLTELKSNKDDKPRWLIGKLNCRKNLMAYSETSKPLIEALLVYYYGGSAESIIQYQKEKKELLQKAKDLMQELQVHFDSPLRLEVKSTYPSFARMSIDRTPHMIYKFADHVDKIVYACERQGSPIKRNDDTAKERLLVFNLYTALQNTPVFRGSSKSAAINHFLSIEGINNSIGQRGVEKLIQGWRKELKEANLLRNKRPSRPQ